MKYIATFLVLFSVYLLLAGFAETEWIVGAIVSVILTILITRFVDYHIDYKLPYRLIVFVFVYVPVFIWQLLLANIDVAKRVLNPRLPLHPGFVAIKTDLTGNFARLMLANSITLTPGTLSVDVDGDTIYVHTVNVQGTTTEEHTKHISALFEKILGVVFR